MVCWNSNNVDKKMEFALFILKWHPFLAFGSKIKRNKQITTHRACYSTIERLYCIFIWIDAFFFWIPDLAINFSASRLSPSLSSFFFVAVIVGELFFRAFYAFRAWIKAKNVERELNHAIHYVWRQITIPNWCLEHLLRKYLIETMTN